MTSAGSAAPSYRTCPSAAIWLTVVITMLLATGCEGLQQWSGTDGNGGATAATTVEEEAEAVAAAGEQREAVEAHVLFERNCSVCHGSDGGGAVGPAQAGNDNLASSSYVVARIQLGGGGMPPFARLLSSSEIAATASYVRTAWENEFGVVSEEQVDLQWNGYRKGVPYGTADDALGRDAPGWSY